MSAIAGLTSSGSWASISSLGRVVVTPTTLMPVACQARQSPFHVHPTLAVEHLYHPVLPEQHLKQVLTCGPCCLDPSCSILHNNTSVGLDPDLSCSCHEDVRRGFQPFKQIC